MQVKKFSVERLGFRGFFILALCFLFLVPATAQELLNYPLDTVNGEEVYRYRVERSIGLYRIGVNFNQLVRRANTLGTVSDRDMREAKRVYQQVLSLLREWEKTWR